MTKEQQAQKAFLDWLKKKDPFLYAVAEKTYLLKQKQKELGFISLANIGDFFKTAVGVVKDVAPKIIEYKQQSKLLDAQVDRAKQGLAPLDTAQYQVVVPYNAAAPTANQAAVVSTIAQQQASSLPSWVLPVGLGLIGFFAIGLLRRRGGTTSG